MRCCTKCEFWKPIREFGKRIANKDGLQSQCKECRAGKEFAMTIADGRMNQTAGEKSRRSNNCSKSS